MEKRQLISSVLICGPQQQVYYKVWLSCSNVFTRWSLGMFVKSEVTGRAYIGLEQNIINTAVNWMEKASPCLCSYSGPTLQAILLQAVEKWTTEWNVSHSVKNVNKMCIYALCQLSNHIALDKKVIFRWLCFPQVVQKQIYGEEGNWVIIFGTNIPDTTCHQMTKVW